VRSASAKDVKYASVLHGARLIEAQCQGVALHHTQFVRKLPRTHVFDGGEEALAVFTVELLNVFGQLVV
jgi:hypothetical protein